jgi:hypothetical protein
VRAAVASKKNRHGFGEEPVAVPTATAMLAWRARTRAVGSGVRLQTGCQDGGRSVLYGVGAARDRVGPVQRVAR